jgi:hypothetical protein
VPWAGFTALLPLRVRSVQQAGLALATGRAPLGLCPLRGLPTVAMSRLVTVTPPRRFVRRLLRPVARTVHPPAALRSVARSGGGFASLEAAFPP